MSSRARITAQDQGRTLAVYGGAGITASTTTRTITGTVVRFNVLGRTSAGRLRVRAGALSFPEDLGTVKLTREHDRDQSRGHMTSLVVDTDRIRASFRVADGPEGDAALREATDRTRDGLSFDVIDAVVEGDEITAGRVIAVGQVGIPAYDDGRVESVAASQQTTGATPAPAAPTTAQEGTPMLTDQERARLAELRAMQNRTAEQTTELEQLAAKAGETIDGQPVATDPAAGTATPSAPAAATTPAARAGQPVAASFSAVPGGVPAPGGPATAQPRGGALQAMCEQLANALSPSGGGGSTSAITAALADVTHAAHSSIITPPAWSGELWSGLQYEPQFTDLLATGDLTNFEGRGWRFVTKMVIQDYAGNKLAIPTSTPTTEQSSYAAARMAVGVDVDRKFYDFPDAAFIQALAEQVRESWAIQLDAKVLAWILANDVAAEGVTTQTDLLKAAGLAIRALKRRRVGRADWVVVNDEDLFTLMDVNTDALPAFLDLFGIEPRNFRSSQDVPAGTVLAGARRTGTLRTLPGSPVRVSAQHIANGGVDEAWFGYWAVEEHHTSGIASVTFDPAFVPA